MSFPPSAACKFLDLPPVNLRNLHLHLTKNPFASRPPHLCGVTLKNLRNKPSSMGVSAPKGSRGRSESPLVASAEAKPLLAGKTSYGRKSGNLVAPIWRDNVQVVGKASWGARLRTRKVTGRDASLPAPLLTVPFELVGRETVGALPQTPPRT